MEGEAVEVEVEVAGWVDGAIVCNFGESERWKRGRKERLKIDGAREGIYEGNSHFLFFSQEEFPCLGSPCLALVTLQASPAS